MSCKPLSCEALTTLVLQTLILRGFNHSSPTVSCAHDMTLAMCGSLPRISLSETGAGSSLQHLPLPPQQIPVFMHNRSRFGRPGGGVGVMHKLPSESSDEDDSSVEMTATGDWRL